MDDTWKSYLSSFILSTALLGNLASAVDLEYISPVQSQTLKQEFAKAHLTAEDQALLRKTPSWSCDMFGMRTKLQVQRRVNLYEFKAADSSFENHGAQPVQDYHFKQNALEGSTTKVIDRLRMTTSGALISELSTASAPHTILAYSVCHSL